MNCKDINKIIDKFYSQATTSRQEKALFNHLEECSFCQKKNYPTYITLKNSYNTISVAVPKKLKSNIMAQILSENKSNKLNPPFKSVKKIVSLKNLAGFAAVAAAIFMFFIFPFKNITTKISLKTDGINDKTNLESPTSFCSVYNYSGTFNIFDGLTWTTGSASTKIPDNTRITTAKNSWVTIQNSTDSTYLVGPQSLFSISNQGRTVKLEFGCLSETVQRGNGKFSVITNCGKVTVIGTRFDVKMTKNSNMLVAVRQGIVAVTDKLGIQRSLRAGSAVKLDSKGFVNKPTNIKLAHPMKEITYAKDFITNLKTEISSSASSTIPALPTGNLKQIILEKDTKPATSKMDFF